MRVRRDVAALTTSCRWFKEPVEPFCAESLFQLFVARPEHAFYLQGDSYVGRIGHVDIMAQRKRSRSGGRCNQFFLEKLQFAQQFVEEKDHLVVT